MTLTSKLDPRAVRYRTLAALAALLTIGACNSDRLGPATSDGTPIATAEPVGDTPTGTDAVGDSTPAAIDTSETLPTDTLSDAEVLASENQPEAAFATASSKPGIAFGAFDLPDHLYNSTVYAGDVAASGPGDIISTLNAARRVGARVVVRLSGGDVGFRNSNRTLNLAKWKAKIARFKKINLKPYINDGTLIGHYILDEPHNSNTWKGQVPYATLEAMAKYSKSIWPTLTTVVRAYPDWLSKASFRWNYLDAAWAQYSGRKGEVKKWMKNQSSYAQREGLGLIVGLNVLNGGDKTSKIKGQQSGSYAMSASQLRSWGGALVSDPMACGFLNWKYSASYYNRSDIKSAMAYLASKAKSRSKKSCRI